MYLTVACPGWKKQAISIPPEQPTESTLEGEAAHWLATLAAGGAASAGIAELIGTNAPNGAEITEEMVDGAMLWVEALEGYPARLEQRVPIQRVHMTKCWGTPDASQWAYETNTLRVADYKFGHAYVDEYENWQLLAYAVGLVDFYNVWKLNDPDIKIQMTVVQPRYYQARPIRTWEITLGELWPYVERMRAAVNEAETTAPRTISGTHCMYCPARVNCQTFGKAVMSAVDFAGRADPMVSTPEQIGRELALVQEFIKRLEARETGLSAMAEGLLRAGQRVPFYSLQPTEGRLKWDVPLDVVESTAKLGGKSALRPPELITPTQAKQRKILDARVIDSYSSRPAGAVKLARDPNHVRKFKA